MLMIDETRGEVTLPGEGGGPRGLPMASAEAFSAVSAAWLRCGWDVKHVYSFTWMGRPVIQLPEDLIRLQELVWRIQPDVIVETGVAHGGSLVFHASLFAALGHGTVIGVDIAIRPANRAAIEAHPLASRITLIEGSSTAPQTLAAVRAAIPPGARVMVVLDSAHGRDHVAAELALYAPLVGPGSYLVVCDGIMAHLVGAPRSAPDWGWNNPLSAIGAFLRENPDFTAEEPAFAFNEGSVDGRVTHWPGGYLRRRAGP